MVNRRQLIETLAGMGALIAIGACTVQPLYAPSSGPAGNPLAGKVEIAPADTRLEQQVRETMLFRIGGGDAQALDPAYRVTLNVTGRSSGIFKVRNADGIDRSRAGQYVASGTMTIVRIDTGKLVDTVSVSALAEFEKSSQEFASERAELDASKRAANELGERLYFALVAKLNREPF